MLHRTEAYGRFAFAPAASCGISPSGTASLPRFSYAASVPPRPLFAFDLDGTVTSAEILPRLAARLGMEREISTLTRKTLSGEIPFAVSFRQRFAMLRQLPLADVHEVIRKVPLNRHIESFIRNNTADCVIVTGNLDVWIEPLVERLGCRSYCSTSAADMPGLSLLHVLDKGQAARELKSQGRPLVAVGESVSDIAMFREADLGFAFAGVHQPVPGLLRLASGVFYCGAELCACLSGIQQGKIPLQAVWNCKRKIHFTDILRPEF